MNFEIIEAYELRFGPETPPRGWSLHVYVPEWGMDIRGARLLKTKSTWFLKMPCQQNYDMEENKLITYPMISFLERGKNKEFMEALKEKAIEYVEKKIADEMIAKEKTFKENKKKPRKNEG